MDDKVIDVLKETGFGKVEIDVYLDLLRNKVSTASDIAKRTHQHRSNVYDSLKRLQERGFITEVAEKGKRYFESKNPEVILSYLKQKEAEVKKILPVLEELSKRKVEPETTSISYGLARVRAILFSIMEYDEEILIWGACKEIEDALGGNFIHEMFLKNRAKKRKSTKLLYDGKFDGIKEASHLKYQKIRFFPKEDYTAMTVILKDSVFFTIFNDPIMTIEMKGKMISQWYTSQFNLLWKIAEIPLDVKGFVVKKTTTLKRKSLRFLRRLKSNNKKL